MRVLNQMKGKPDEIIKSFRENFWEKKSHSETEEELIEQKNAWRVMSRPISSHMYTYKYT